LAIYPSAGFLAATAAVDSIYRTLKEMGITTSGAPPLYPFYDMGRLMGFDEVRAFERRHAEE
jgi:hypothetical protein